MVKICDQFFNAASLRTYEPLPTPARRLLGAPPVFASLSHQTLHPSNIAINALEEGNEPNGGGEKTPNSASKATSSNKDTTMGGSGGGMVDGVIPTPITLSIRVMGNTRLRIAHGDVYGGTYDISYHVL